ncbi:all-trans retinoic acid-induced differentiation factor isoform X2 [Cuculus canorus]|uniref:all-trans retinoic acid-induced differentiation factor isoform X2 n=1 Tax=Cuculus canorus TaxID=55661 RepID=UPI0023AAE623|nr:all-trans retinoic acid-induced differentiation factor isoform X2 [Cuculus canorus]
MPGLGLPRSLWLPGLRGVQVGVLWCQGVWGCPGWDSSGVLGCLGWGVPSIRVLQGSGGARLGGCPDWGLPRLGFPGGLEVPETRVPGFWGCLGQGCWWSGGAGFQGSQCRPCSPPPQVCGHCPGPPQNSSIVAQFCASRGDTESEGRCCRERGTHPEHVLGLDLSNCSLHTLPPGLNEAAAAIVLALPLDLDCPGGSSAWEVVTILKSSRLCQGQQNPCNGSRELVWPCPENSVCAPDGPGMVQCLCQSPFHGYKCLREGAFPTFLFCGVLGAVTLCLALLLWGTQRRKAKTL